MIEGKTVKKVETHRHVSAYTIVGYTIFFTDGTSLYIWASDSNLQIEHGY
jgi:hypothetical protein